MTYDNVGRPRSEDIIERDNQLHAKLVELGAESGVRIRDVADALDLTLAQAQYSVRRLRAQGRAERRRGYRWWPLP